MNEKNKERKRQKKSNNQKKLFGIGMLYLLPSLLLLAVFLFYPIFRTLYFSFFDVTGGGVVQEFIGLSYYKELWASADFRKSLINTFLFVLITVPAEILIALFLAILASEKIRGMGFFRMIFASTLGVSAAAGATIFLFLLHPSLGVFNNMLALVGIDPIPWLTSSKWALLSVAMTTVWMHIGINFIILLGGVQNVDKELYESADMDGAGYFRKLFNITIPLITPVLFFVSIIALIGSFQTFGQIDILTSGGPAGSTNIIVYSIFQEAFRFGNFGYGSAQAIVLFLIILVVTTIQYVVGEKRVHYQ